MSDCWLDQALDLNPDEQRVERLRIIERHAKGVTWRVVVA
jgi:hypothetical protein